MAENGRLMFACPATREEFDSGFQFSADDLAKVPREYTMRVRCRSCLQVHEFSLANAWIATAGL